MNRQMIRAGVMSIGLLFLCGCSVKHTEVTLSQDKGLTAAMVDDALEHKILALEKSLQSLSADVDEAEARAFSRAAVLYPYHLAKRYGLVSPPQFHNFLITVGLKERGLCYHWTQDMIAYLKQQGFKSFDLYRAVAEQGDYDEHNALVVTARGRPFSEGIVLDAWRDSSELFFKRVDKDREYFWVQNMNYKVVRG